MRLRFSDNKINDWAEQYDYPLGPAPKIPVPDVKQAGFLTLDQLRILAKWKSPRSARHIDDNNDAYVRAITRFALQATEERAKIESLTILDGVGWPTASAILHFFDKGNYPVLDFRALWSVGVKRPRAYTFCLWQDYFLFCREVAHRAGCEMRTLDCALWAYSKAKQPAAGPSDA